MIIHKNLSFLPDNALQGCPFKFATRTSDRNPASENELDKNVEVIGNFLYKFIQVFYLRIRNQDVITNFFLRH